MNPLRKFLPLSLIAACVVTLVPLQSSGQNSTNHYQIVEGQLPVGESWGRLEKPKSTLMGGMWGHRPL